MLALLLSDATEKEIAWRLGIGHRTMHQHAEAIYAKLGVRGRIGLMALWLRFRRRRGEVAKAGEGRAGARSYLQGNPVRPQKVLFPVERVEEQGRAGK